MEITPTSALIIFEAIMDRDHYHYDEYRNSPNLIERYKKGELGNEGYLGFGQDSPTDFLRSGPDHRKLFWDCLEIITGIPATDTQRNIESFTCSC